jgi:hypothetical protein
MALGETQRRLARLITAPEGVAAGLAAEGDSDGAQLAAVVRGDRGLAPADRLAVYANAYHARLEECLRGYFGALASALGADAFHDLVATYLMMHPPHRPSLRHAGARLADHLATEPFAEIFGRLVPHAADLARLEWAMSEAFLAADAPALGRDALAAVAPDAWAGLRFELVPSLRLVRCAWPVHLARDAFEAGAAAPALPPAPTPICVWRSEERVRRRPLDPVEAAALDAVGAGDTFGGVCERIAETVAEAEVPARASGFLATWLAGGLLARASG